MKIILLDNLNKHRFIEAKTVRSGYGKYLINLTKAVVWKKELEQYIKPLSNEEVAQQGTKKKIYIDYVQCSSILKKQKIIFQEKVSNSGRLFGSINDESVKKYLEKHFRVDEINHMSITFSNKNHTIIRYIKFPGEYYFYITPRPLKKITNTLTPIPFQVIKYTE